MVVIFCLNSLTVTVVEIIFVRTDFDRSSILVDSGWQINEEYISSGIEEGQHLIHRRGMGIQLEFDYITVVAERFVAVQRFVGSQLRELDHLAIIRTA